MKKIAVLASDLSILDGVSAVAKFLYDVINKSERYRADFVSVSTSARDADSLRILQPMTWLKGLQISSHDYEGIPYRHVGANFTEIEYFRYRPRRVLNQILQNYDLVQVVAGLPMWTLAAREFPGKIALQVATLTRVERQSMIEHAPQPRKTYLQAMSKINESLEKQAFERANAIFVENHWLKEKLEKIHPEKTIFAPPGVDTNFFKPEDYAENGYILSVGRFHDRRKNLPMLFRAYKSLFEKMPSAAAPRLVLAGNTAPVESDLKLAEDLKIRSKIDVFTELTKERLRETYQKAAVFVLSSTEEGFGLVIAEAMACGLPIVATRCGGPQVLVEENENGFLVSVNDAEAMSAKLFELLSDSDERRKFGLNGRQKAVEKFSIAATGKIYLETYDKLLSCERD